MITKTTKRILSILLIILAAISISQFAFAKTEPARATAPTHPFAALLNIKGAIGPAVQDYIERGIKQAEKEKANVVVLRMDTPGGLSKSMRGIIKAILSSPVPIITFVAPSGARAASAGTYILYASQIAAMAPGTNLGAATPVSIGSPGGNKDKDKKAKQKSAAELKALNDARAYIRSLAQLRGRNAKWAEKAVLKGESLSAEEALKLNVIDVVANNIPTLFDKVNGKTVQVRGLPMVLKTKGLIIKPIEPDWKTKFLTIITDPSVAYVLLMVGFYGLFFEFANPGFIVPGVAGAICLLLALYSFQLLPINYVGLGLILLGMAFIVGEAFMPSFGALGIGGIIALAIGSIMLMRTDVPGYSLPLRVIFSVVGVSALFFAGAIWLAVRSRGRKVVSGREDMIGKTGKVIVEEGKKWLWVNSERWKIADEAAYNEGELVEVEQVDGLTLKVKRLESKES